MSNRNMYSVVKTYTRFSILQCIAFSFVIMFSFGVMNIYFSDRNNYCAMTYMFEYPQFVKITMPDSKIYAQYGLYAYSEGRATEKTRKMWFDGIPVLFLPGNSGSHMQVRSLASVALRKALEDIHSYHFDYFTVDYNEELSGLYGGVLEGQTQFAALCINKILSLYKYNKYTRTIPRSIILIGHSMGGVIAKRLLTYPDTRNSVIVAIALAAPLQGPVINVDTAMNNYYMTMRSEWTNYTKFNYEHQKKILISFGNGPRDLLIPSALIYSSSSMNALTTSIPGVWVSPDHVSIVWCKQLVLTINRFLFSIIDRRTGQVVEDKKIKIHHAELYFQAKRSMIINPTLKRANTTMLPDAFWYEDNRRIYQITRPEIEKTTYLMIRLVSYPHNRFVAVESVDLEDKDWIFGCNAKYVHNMHRYCQEATSLTELSRWTAAAVGFGRRKLATVNLHSIRDNYNWSHVIVKISPTRKPVTLNVDINDYHSRQISVTNDWNVFMNTVVLKEATEVNSLYYELTIHGFNLVHQAFLLYVEPVGNCKTNQYHASAEFHVPWAENHEYYHYFTYEKRSPMKLRLFKNDPNVTLGIDPSEPVKVTLLLDPQCSFTIKFTASWYHSLAQLTRNYAQVLVPYIAALALLVARNNFLHLKQHGMCISIHSAAAKDGFKHFYILVFEKVLATAIFSIPLLRYLTENASDDNYEMQYFIRSLLVIPAYITAFGLFIIFAALILFVMVFSSQFTYKLLYRVVRRGWAEGAAGALQRLPQLASAALLCATPLSCGAASLLAGAIFYAFKISKMYEDYIEDFTYKLLAIVSSYLCQIFYLKKKKDVEKQISSEIVRAPDSTENKKNVLETDEAETSSKVVRDNLESEVAKEERINETDKSIISKCAENDVRTKKGNVKTSKDPDELDEDLSDLNFHMTMFIMWLIVTVINAPVLFSWARNYKYSMTLLQHDTSSIPGLLLSICSVCIWQLKGPRQNLKHYDEVCTSLYIVAGVILVLGPIQMYLVNYGVTLMFVVVTIQQLCDKEQHNDVLGNQDNKNNDNTTQCEDNRQYFKEDTKTNDTKTNESSKVNEDDKSECDVCNANRIYDMFRRFKEKFNVFENL